MLQLIEQHRAEIEALCRKYGVIRLDLFGSAASGDSFTSDSDVDFFFEFDTNPVGLTDRYFGLIEELESLLRRKVDLVSIQDVHNPYFLQVANEYRTPLYAA